LLSWHGRKLGGGPAGPSSVSTLEDCAITGSILKGVKPAELPVQQAVKFDFVINRGTATLLGIEVAPQLLAIANEVIE